MRGTGDRLAKRGRSRHRSGQPAGRKPAGAAGNPGKGTLRLAMLPAALVVTDLLAACTTAPAVTARGSGSWPAVSTNAMSYARTGTAVPLEAPATLPAAGCCAANSARVHAGGTYYAVGLYGCPTALPVNNPGIVRGTCGALASVYGGFGATPTGARPPPWRRCRSRLPPIMPGVPGQSG